MAAKEEVVRSTHPVTCGWAWRSVVLVVATTAMWSVVQRGCSGLPRPTAGTTQADEFLPVFSAAAGHKGEQLPVRLKAAKALAKAGTADAWIALLLLRPYAPPVVEDTDDAEEVRGRAAGMKRFELAVTVAIIRNLPPKSGKTVLWALTMLLGEEDVAEWGTTTGVLLWAKHVHYVSRPVRELAREYLKGELGVDHGWDAAAWQSAILNSSS